MAASFRSIVTTGTEAEIPSPTFLILLLPFISEQPPPLRRFSFLYRSSLYSRPAPPSPACLPEVVHA